MTGQSDTIRALLNEAASAGTGDRVTVADVLTAVGGRSFGAILFIPSMVVITPLSGIPGVPTTIGIIIMLVCAQVLIGRRTIWLPGPILRRSLRRDRLQRAVLKADPVLRRLEALVRPRLTFLINRVTVGGIALISACLAATLPPLEALPFTASTTGVLLALFSLALMVRDGALVLLALTATAVAVSAFVILVVPHLPFF